MTHKMVRLDANRVMAIGGKKQDFLNSCELYHLETNTWNTVASMRHPRSQPSVFVLKGSVYVYGGFMADNSISPGMEVYTNGTWQYLDLDFSPYNNMIVRSISVVKDDSRVLLIGGSNGKDASSTILTLETSDMTITKSSQTLSLPVYFHYNS